jgi:hypothetical protein
VVSGEPLGGLEPSRALLEIPIPFSLDLSFSFLWFENDYPFNYVHKNISNQLLKITPKYSF